jgi:hypothetical protein
VNRLSLIFIVLILLSVSAARADDEVGTISFAENSMPAAEHKVQPNGVGLSVHGIDGLGVFYERGLGPRVRAHAEVFLNLKERPAMPYFDKSETVGAADFAVRNQFSISIGADRFFNLTDDGRWSLLAGAAAMYAAGSAQAKFYPAMCSWLYCGFNPNVVMKDQTINETAFVGIVRAGVRYSGIKIMGRKSDFAFVLNMQALRSSKAQEFQSPDGRVIASGVGNAGTIALESSLAF